MNNVIKIIAMAILCGSGFMTGYEFGWWNGYDECQNSSTTTFNGHVLTPYEEIMPYDSLLLKYPDPIK